MSLRNLSFIALWLALFLYGTFNFISDSEFWPMAVAKEFGHLPMEHPVLIYKPLFHAILKVPYFFELSSGGHILFSKALFAAIGSSAAVFILYWIGRISGLRVLVAFIILLFLSETYFTNFFKIRSDVISLALTVAALGISYSVLKRKKLTLKDQIILGLLSGLLFLGTPKAFYHLLVLAAFNFGMLRSKGEKVRQALRQVFYWHGLGPIAMVGVSGLIAGAIGINLTQAIGSAFTYFISGYSKPQIGLGSQDLYFVYRGLQIDWAIWVLSFVGWIQLVRLRRTDPLSAGALWAWPVAVAAMFLHNQRLPFFWASFWPILILPAAQVIGQSPWPKWKYAAILSIVFVGFLHSLVPPLWFTSNIIQRKLITEIEEVIQVLPDKRVFDGLGLFPRSDLILAFFSPGDTFANIDAVRTLQQRLPGVVIYSPRSALGEPHISRILDEHYSSVGAGVWILNNQSQGIRFSMSEPLGSWFSFEPPMNSFGH